MRIAAAQPPASDGPGEARVGEALGLVEAAAGAGAGVVVFPEGYPGPLRASERFDATPEIRGAAERHGCAVCWSRIEEVDGRHRMVAYVDRPDGRESMRYERAHPATGDVHPTLSGVPLAPGDGFGIAEVGGIRIGVLICSELWLPEVARILALRGAELILAPAGGGFGPVGPNWQLIARARAIENQCFVALTQWLFGDEPGAALIAGPEGTLASRTEPGLCVADLDLERARWLRASDDTMREPRPFASLPGLLRARRPGLYGELSEPREGLYRYEADEGNQHPRRGGKPDPGTA